MKVRRLIGGYTTSTLCRSNGFGNTPSTIVSDYDHSRYDRSRYYHPGAAAADRHDGAGHERVAVAMTFAVAMTSATVEPHPQRARPR